VGARECGAVTSVWRPQMQGASRDVVWWLFVQFGCFC
jgi:hypothetical protein